MRQSESLYFDIRGLRYHVRHWPGRAGRSMVLLHGWMDVSASFQFLVDALGADWDIYAPDWRGYGLSDWVGADSYWFSDYVAGPRPVAGAHPARRAGQPRRPQPRRKRRLDLRGHSAGTDRTVS